MNEKKFLRIKIVLDVFGYFLSIGPCMLIWTFAYFYLQFAIDKKILLLAILFLPLFLSLLFILTIFIIRKIIPKLVPGKHDVGFNIPSIAWYSHLALNRATKISGIRPILHSFYFTKFLLYNALGAKIGYGSNTSIEFVLVDVGLISMGKNCVLGEGVHISCHYFLGTKLILRPVVIGDNVFISSHCIIGPGSNIGDGSWIGYGNAIAGESLPANSKLDNFAWRLGGPTQPKPDYLKPLFENKE